MNAKEIFLSAVERLEPADWPAFLEGICGDNAVLRQQVEDLLKVHQQQDSLFDVAPTKEQVTQSLGQRIGPYKLLHEIGEGGMGTVYMAE